MSWQTAAVVRVCASRTVVSGAPSRSFTRYGNTARELPRVHITLNNAGIGRSTGDIPNTFEEMARDSLVLIDALGLGEIDIPGFSIGSMVAQNVAHQRRASAEEDIEARSESSEMLIKGPKNGVGSQEH